MAADCSDRLEMRESRERGDIEMQPTMNTQQCETPKLECGQKAIPYE